MAQTNGFEVFLILYGVIAAAAPLAAQSPVRKSAKADAAQRAIEQVLLRETASRVDRREELGDAMRQQPDSDQLRWQSGYIRDGRIWRSFDALGASSADAEKLVEYRERRGTSSATAAGQLELA